MGIFRVWAERVRVCKTPSGPASLCSLECSFRGSVVLSYTDCIHLNPKPEVDWPIPQALRGDVFPPTAQVEVDTLLGLLPWLVEGPP